MKKQIVLVIFALFSLQIIYSGGTPEVYKKAVGSIGLITDKSGAIASGFFINPKTFITNHHVTNDLDIRTAKIEMKDDRTYKVKKIITERKINDLAIVEISDECEDVLELADENRINKNDIVYSIGNPTDEDMNVDYFHISKGRVKKVEDDTWYYDNENEYTHEAFVIQHTAIIKPGNSGGPLLNEEGQVIGVNTFFYGDSSNYAIHVDELVKILIENDIAYNKASYKEKQYTNRERKKRTIRQRFVYLFERQAEIIENYSVVFALFVSFYYSVVFLGAIIITVYVITSRPSPKKIKYQI